MVNDTTKTVGSKLYATEWNAMANDVNIAMNSGSKHPFDYVINFKNGYYRAWDAGGGVTSAAYIGGLINDIKDTAKSIQIICTGSLTVDEKITLSSNYIHLVSTSWYNVLTAKNSLNDNVLEITGDYCLLDNISIDGNSGSQSGTCHGLFNHGNNSIINNINITTCRSDGLHNGESSWNSDTMGGWINGGRIVYCSGSGLYQDYTATDWQVQGLLIHTCNIGIMLDASSGRFSNSHLWGNVHNMQCMPTQHVSRVNFVNMGFMDNYVSHNVYVDNSGGKIMDACTFSGCNFWGKLTSGVNTDRDGIHVTTDTNFYGNTICGCTFKGENEAGTNQGRYAIGLGNNCDNNIIIGNAIKGWLQSNPIYNSGSGNLTGSNVYRGNGP